MSKYDPLGAYLRRRTAAEVPMSFDDIERVTGVALPPKAQAQRAWWSNNPSNNVLTKVWLEAGFRTERVDLAARRLVFRRAEQVDAGGSWKEGDPIPLVDGRHPIFGCLKDVTHLVPGVDLTGPACPEWVEIAETTTL